jgi:hypothetical protein
LGAAADIAADEDGAAGALRGDAIR